MTRPTAELQLSLLLRGHQDLAQRSHIAALATRLGYRGLWLTVEPSNDARALRDAAALADHGFGDIGLVTSGAPGDVVQWLRRAGPRLASVSVELDSPAAHRDDLIEAAGGLDAWSLRVHTRAFDPDAAGCVLRANSRDALIAAARGAVAAHHDAAGRTAHWTLSAAVGVSIGRTMSEATARAMRDPVFSNTHPRESGIFGTLEDAQAQADELATAGFHALRADLPEERDIADLIAQLRAAVAGPAGVHHGPGQRRRGLSS